MPGLFSLPTSRSNNSASMRVNVSESLEKGDRPLEIVEDVRFTEQRRRVSSALGSRNFREDLEAVLEAKADVRPLHSVQTVPLTDMNICGRITANQIPINDTRGREGFSRQEKDLRCKLAALCRLISLQGWASGIYNHVSARVDAKDEYFLVNPFGILYYEITATSLIKVDGEGNIVGDNSSGFSYNRSTFVLHSAIHRIRPDVRCVVHLHSQVASTVSCLKEGLLPLCYEALLLGGVSYHEYGGIRGEDLAKNLLCNDLGPFNKVLVLRNHGIAICAESVEEAWSLICNTMKSCQTQCEAMAAVGGDVSLLTVPSENVQKQMIEASRVAPICLSAGEKQWRTGELEFEAAMRLLDNSGMRTGYVYKFPFELKSSAAQYECTIPAVQSSLTFADRQGRLCRTWAGRSNHYQKAEWLISPNSYVKQQSGGDVPFSCTKWSADAKLSPSTLIRIDKHSFVPLGTDLQELKKKQEQIKENRLTGQVSAGPITELYRHIDHFDDKIPADISDRKIIIGAASRAIVKREEQHNPAVYQSAYEQNPFLLPAYDDSGETDSVIKDSQRISENDQEQRVLGNVNTETTSDSSANRASSPEQKTERKKSSFRTPSFLKRKKRECVNVEKHCC